MSWDDIADRINRSAMRPFLQRHEVLYLPRGAAAFRLDRTVWGRAEVTYSENDADVVAMRPTLGVHLDDFPNAPRIGDTLIRDGIEYQVSSVEIDGERGAMLVLLGVGL